MLHYGFITEQSRKAKSARNLYERLRRKVDQQEWIPSIQIENLHGSDGIRVPPQDRPRVWKLRFLDEHLSPYFKTNLNLFQMHMLDDSVDVTVYRAARGWLFIFEHVIDGPTPFAQHGQHRGYDMR
ncbi:MAG: hypothetical protein K6T31_00385 [Alicyclobacillus sp.]|nr:hypothetical protein [Alicyclobacillus sp.]